MKKTLIALTIVSIILTLTGCQTSTQTPRMLTANDYLQLAAMSHGTEQWQLQLQAAERYLDSEQTQQAITLLNQLAQQPLLTQQRAALQLLLAKANINQRHTTRAIQLLQQLNSNALTAEQRQQQRELLALIYEQQGDLIASIQQRSQLLAFENTQEQKQTLIQIWLSLQSVPQAKLDTLNDPSLPRDIQGWFALNQAINNNPHSGTPITSVLADWQQRFPKHPANALLPSNLNATNLHQAPQHIALLLPLTGANAESAEAIKNGFFTAYYYDKQHQSNPPSISVVDTSKGDIDSIYRQAVNDGADFVVGPLTKNHLATLIQSQHMSVPTLALNTLSNTHATNNLYQFGLSPYDETSQLVKQAIKTDHHRALIIAPNTSWGQDIASRLNNEWQQQGGTTIATMNYTTRNQLSTDIKRLLNIQASYNRGYAIRNILNDKDIRIISRRRQDFDSIFLVAQPDFARQIKPLLSFYFAGDIPVYATSQLYSGQANTSSDRDLNNIIFCDMPWVLSPDTMHPSFLKQLQQQSKSIWPSSYQKNPKLYALGIDAYNLTHHINTMKLLPDLGTPAATGTLFIDNNHIYRKLKWAQFSQGKPTLL